MQIECFDPIKQQLALAMSFSCISRHSLLLTPASPLGSGPKAVWICKSAPTYFGAFIHQNCCVDRSAPAYAVRVCPGKDLSPQKLVEQLQEAGVEAAVSSVLPDDFLVVTGLQHLIRQGFMQQGSCQVNPYNPYTAPTQPLHDPYTAPTQPLHSPYMADASELLTKDAHVIFSLRTLRF